MERVQLVDRVTFYRSLISLIDKRPTGKKDDDLLKNILSDLASRCQNIDFFELTSKARKNDLKNTSYLFMKPILNQVVGVRSKISKNRVSRRLMRYAFSIDYANRIYTKTLRMEEVFDDISEQINLFEKTCDDGPGKFRERSLVHYSNNKEEIDKIINHYTSESYEDIFETHIMSAARVLFRDIAPMSEREDFTLQALYDFNTVFGKLEAKVQNLSLLRKILDSHYKQGVSMEMAA